MARKFEEMIPATQAAAQLGITRNRVAQICRGHRSPKKFGKKLGRDWFLSPREIKQIAALVLRRPENFRNAS